MESNPSTYPLAKGNRVLERCARKRVPTSALRLTGGRRCLGGILMCWLARRAGGLTHPGRLGRSRPVSPGDLRLSTAVPLRYAAKVTLFTIHNIMDGPSVWQNQVETSYGHSVRSIRPKCEQTLCRVYGAKASWGNNRRLDSQRRHWPGRFGPHQDEPQVVEHRNRIGHVPLSFSLARQDETQASILFRCGA